MDPFAIFKLLWTYKWITIPFVAIIVVVCGAAFVYGPRAYDSTSSYVVISPGAPSEDSIKENPSLAQESNNPYLRSDPSLAAQVVATRLSAGDIAQTLQSEGLSTDYVVTTATEIQSNQIIRITATADTPEKAVATSEQLGDLLAEQLAAIQSAGGADSRFYLVAQPVGPPGSAIEKTSSRLRTVMVLGIAGVVLLFGAISLARAVQNHRLNNPATDDVDDDIDDREGEGKHVANAVNPSDVPHLGDGHESEVSDTAGTADTSEIPVPASEEVSLEKSDTREGVRVGPR